MSVSQSEAASQVLPVHKYFASTVTLVTSQSETGHANVMACEWTTNICHKPLLIMSVVHKDDLTHELLLSSKEFGVNVCSDQQSALVRLAGNYSGHAYDKMSDPLMAEALVPASRIKAPMIRGCLLNIECILEQTLDMNTHTAFIGRAIAARCNPKLRPLIYHQGRFAYFGEWIPKPNSIDA